MELSFSQQFFFQSALDKSNYTMVPYHIKEPCMPLDMPAPDMRCDGIDIAHDTFLLQQLAYYY